MAGLGACEAGGRLVPAIRGRGHASSPVLFAAPGKPTSFSLPSKYRGCGAPKGAPLFPCVSISCGDARASRRATAASSGSRAALLAAVGLPEEPSDPSPCGGISPSIGQSQGLRTISELLAGGPSASSIAVCFCANCVNLFARAPAPPGRDDCVCHRPRAPHPVPSFRRL